MDSEMPEGTEESDRHPTLNDPEESRRLSSYWMSQINAVEEAHAYFYKRGDTINKRYRDERKGDGGIGQDGQTRMNLLWSSVQILKPAVYSKVPQAVAERKFNDRDPIGRTSAIILERALRNELMDNGFHQSMRRARDDYLLPGRGQLWVRYEPEFGPSASIPTLVDPDQKDAEGFIRPEDDSEEEEKLEDTGSQIVAESAPVDYINWKDFGMIPATARTWEEVQAVYKRCYTSKTYNKERFGDDIGDKIKPDPKMSVVNRIKRSDTPFSLDSENARNYVIYEIWDKASRQAIWVSTGYDELCDIQDDPLQLKGFFPCPEPLSATMTNDTLIPVADFIEYQDQANQVDELTYRITLLSKALKVAGCYNSAAMGLRRLLDESVENELIPVDNWAAFAEKGGLQGSITFMPIKEIMEVLQGLVEIRRGVLDDFERITGIQALVSQTGDGRETLGGQRLKSNGAQTRIDDRREEVARFARDVVRLVGEVVARHFQPSTLIEASGILYEEGIDPGTMAEMALDAPQQPQQPPQPLAPPGGQPMVPQGAQPLQGGLPAVIPPPTLQPIAPQFSPKVMAAMARIKKAVDLLKNDIARGYRIDIETDTMIAGDVEQERADATALLEAMTKFMEAANMIGAQNPDSIPVLTKMLQFGVRKFRTGRDLEATLDEFADRMEKKAQAMAAGLGQHQNPEAAKGAAEAQKAQAEIAKAKLDMAAQQANDQREQQLASDKHAMEMQKMQTEMEMMRERHAFEMQKLAAERMAHAAEQGLPAPTMETATAQGHKDGIRLIHESASMIHKAANTRKRVVRGPDNRIIAIEPEEGA